jgi:hypothetical protein
MGLAESSASPFKACTGREMLWGTNDEFVRRRDRVQRDLCTQEMGPQMGAFDMPGKVPHKDPDTVDFDTGYAPVPRIVESRCLSRKALQSNLVIVFDWDDTLMCTTDIKQAERLRDSDSFDSLYDRLSFTKELEQVVLTLLKKAMNLGTVVIVTNADLPWVRNSAQLVLPGALPLLQKLTVFSAQEAYKDLYPGDASIWKMLAFQDLLQHATSLEESVNLVSIGDSLMEIRAAEISVQERNDDSIVKTVKLRDRPTARQIVGQLEAITAELSGIAFKQANFTFELRDQEPYGWVLEELCPSCSSNDSNDDFSMGA